jgi:predicted RNA-binding protein with PUA-like domain
LLAKPKVELGDLIFYDWGKGEGVSHVTVVTKIEPSGYPDVSEWSANEDGTDPAPTNMRGFTWSAVSNKWLQEKYPHISAYLLHIDTKGSSGNP